jgi:hypothetical protein
MLELARSWQWQWVAGHARSNQPRWHGAQRQRPVRQFYVSDASPLRECPVQRQPGCRDESGHGALFELKQPDSGGYEDYDDRDTVYIVSEKDKLWKDLRIWIDENRDGVSQPSELHKLSEFGIKTISLIPAMTGKYDEWGNWFRYAAPVNIEVKDVRTCSLKNDARIQNNTPHELDVQTYDIFLVNSEIPAAK